MGEIARRAVNASIRVEAIAPPLPDPEQAPRLLQENSIHDTQDQANDHLWNEGGMTGKQIREKCHQEAEAKE